MLKVVHPFSSWRWSVFFWSLWSYIPKWWQLKYFWNVHPEPRGRWTLQMGWNHQPVYLEPSKHGLFQIKTRGTCLGFQVPTFAGNAEKIPPQCWNRTKPPEPPLYDSDLLFMSKFKYFRGVWGVWGGMFQPFCWNFLIETQSNNPFQKGITNIETSHLPLPGTLNTQFSNGMFGDFQPFPQVKVWNHPIETTTIYKWLALGYK